MVFDQQRLEHINEFLTAMTSLDAHEAFGTLLSGPNGVGKSALNFASALTLFARGLAVIYIPTSEQVTTLGTTDATKQFFLKIFFKQNADLLLDPTFRNYLPFFRDLLVNLDSKPHSHVFDDFCEFLTDNLNTEPRCGLVMDEF